MKEAVLTTGPDGEASVRVDLGPVRWSPASVPAALAGKRIVDRAVEVNRRTFLITCVSLGNPHCVVFTDNLSDRFVREWGPRFESHVLFPHRINTEFVQVLSADEVRVRVWERGCGETLACGTGAAAVCAAGSETGRTGRRLLCRMRGESHAGEDRRGSRPQNRSGKDCIRGSH